MRWLLNLKLYANFINMYFVIFTVNVFFFFCYLYSRDLVPRFLGENAIGSKTFEIYVSCRLKIVHFFVILRKRTQ